jgi:hypothetical protein
MGIQSEEVMNQRYKENFYSSNKAQKSAATFVSHKFFIYFVVCIHVARFLSHSQGCKLLLITNR